MPKWSGKWPGGRYYLDEVGRKVFFIERRGKSRRIPGVHDETTAVGALARFLDDPTCFDVGPDVAPTRPVYATTERINAYLESIRTAVTDHRTARKKYLAAWSALGLDLRTVERETLRLKLEKEFKGGHRGRVEALNAFARWLVKRGDLVNWRPLENHVAAKATRAEREAYTLEQLQGCWNLLPDTGVRDVFLLRAATGMHQTEIDQLHEARLYTAPLPDKGTGIRTLSETHEIAGVLQVKHKNGQRHRQSVNAACLASALRLQAEGVPNRASVWKAMKPLVPSNLRHTFDSLAGEHGVLVTWTGAGVDRSRIAQAMGHRAGSTMGPDRYEKLQVPPMIRLPLGF